MFQDSNLPEKHILTRSLIWQWWIYRLSKTRSNCLVVNSLCIEQQLNGYGARLPSLESKPGGFMIESAF